jgi:hypothetical protein
MPFKRKWTRVARLASALACIAAICGSRTFAQTLEPRAYSNSPVGLNFLVAGYDYGKGEVGFDPSIPLTDAHITLNVEVFDYTRSFDAWGNSAKYDIVLPVVKLDGTALFDGEPRSRQANGLGDPLFKVAVNLYGSPAMSLPEFKDYHQDLIVGASLRVSAPLGQYDSTKLVNIGSNRWSFKPEIAFSQAEGPWTFDWYTGVTFYTENDDFFNGGTSKQDPLLSTQAHVMRAFSHGIWAALDATYYWGGRSTINGRLTDSLQANSRFGATLALPISRSMSIKLNAAAGTSARTGNNFNDVAIAWQYRWGAGL